MKEITEGKAKVLIYEPKDGIVSKDLPVFYNPLMKFNRDVTIALLKTIDKKLKIGDPLAGSGIRSVRMLKELDVGELLINDISSDAVDLIKKNLKLNNEHENEKVSIHQEDANLFILTKQYFDYLDIDPFGSPNNFLDSAVKKIYKGGILAVTATDTAPLSGTYPKTGTRKYWAKTIRNEHKHEAGIRILIRKVQLIGAQFEKALTPIISYSKDHYFRIFFRVDKGKQKCDELLKQHEYFHYCSVCANHYIDKNNKSTCCKETQDAGPLWTGKLFDKEILEKMDFKKWIDEAEMLPFFYDLHTVCKKHKLAIPKTDVLMEEIRKTHKVSRTHFLDTAIKTDLELKELIKIIKIIP